MNSGDYEGKSPLHIDAALGDLEIGNNGNNSIAYSMATFNVQDRF